MSRNRNNEDGAALVVVLCLLVLMSLLAASAVTISQTGLRTVKTSVDRTYCSYLAESAASRAMWLLVNDKIKNPDRQLGSLDYKKMDGERFLSDSVTHRIECFGGQADVSIYDMNSGMDISGSDPVRELRSLSTAYADDGEKSRRLLSLFDKILDYVDSDDFLRSDGMEKADYASQKMPNLPRNAPFQFREELLLIPGIEEFIQPDENGRLSAVKPIPLQGMQNAGGGGAVSFFGATKQDIMWKCSFSSEEADNVIRARTLWRAEKIPLEDSLRNETLAVLKNKFSFRESGCHTMMVEAFSSDDGVRRRLVMSFQISTQIPSDGISYYEWTLY